MKAYIVTLSMVGKAVRPKYGLFLWNSTYGRYVWRGEIATTMGQMAELFTQAADFLRQIHDFYEKLSFAEVEIEAEEQMSGAEQEVARLAAEVQELTSEKDAIMAHNMELLAMLEKFVGKTPPKNKRQLRELIPATKPNAP